MPTAPRVTPASTKTEGITAASRPSPSGWRSPGASRDDHDQRAHDVKRGDDQTGPRMNIMNFSSLSAENEVLCSAASRTGRRVREADRGSIAGRSGRPQRSPRPHLDAGHCVPVSKNSGRLLATRRPATSRTRTSRTRRRRPRGRPALRRSARPGVMAPKGERSVSSSPMSTAPARRQVLAEDDPRLVALRGRRAPADQFRRDVPRPSAPAQRIDPPDDAPEAPAGEESIACPKMNGAAPMTSSCGRCPRGADCPVAIARPARSDGR